VLAGLGYDRAVLARELTLREIRFLAEKSPIPVEIFIHGALCFCFSGLCLMSSYLGGKGSLRGACTQPCRRRYTAGSKRGHYFSPLDLEAVDLMPQIRDLPLAALKIEGRMKGPQYVDPVVRAYRLLLDAPPEDWEKTQAEARALIETSLGRPRCSGFFLGPRAPGALAPHLAATSGRFVGKIIEIEPDGGRLILKEPLTLGDRLRIRSREDESQKAFTLKHLWAGGHDVDQAGAGSEVWIGLPDPPAFGDLVFKVDTAKGEKEALASDLVRVVREAGPAKKEPRPTPAFSKIMAELDNPNPYRPRETRTEIWYRVGRAEDAPGVDDVRPDRIILPVSPANVRKVASGRKRGEWVERLIWSLDPLVFEGDRAGLRKELAQVVRMGGQRFMIANLGHLPLLDLELPGRRGRPIVYADHRLGCLNHQAERLLADLGVSGVTVSLESDGENLSLLLDHPGPVARLAYLYGRPSLFTSRFQPDGLKDGYPVESPREERLRVRNRPGHFEVFAERPIFMAPLLRSPAGFAAFIVDLEHDPRPAATARTVAETIRRGRSLTGTSRFNLTRGLF
jgi:putative protease